MLLSDPFDDERLDALLKQAGNGMSTENLREFAAGAAGAPTGQDPEAWIELAVQGADAAVKKELVKFVGAIRDKGDGLGESPARPARLAALRAELASRHLDGFVVPLADEHQGEFVPARARRLAWLTGFTGSAGMSESIYVKYFL